MSERTIRILKDFRGYSEGKICFRTGAAPEDVYDMGQWAFEHSGPEYDIWSPASIQMLKERLLMGQEAPSVMILNHDQTPEVAAAAALFEYPPLLLDNSFNTLLDSIGMISRYGNGFLAHVPFQHSTLIRGFHHIIPDTDDPLRKGVDLIANFVENSQLPDVPPPPNPSTLLEDGSFVTFEGPPEGWSKMWTDGRLCGIRFGEDESSPEIIKKSPYVRHIDLYAVTDRLNEKEDEDIWETDGVIASIPNDSETSLSRNTITDIAQKEMK
jgi:hypothetical protein